jgi:hypothetical protein
MGYILWGGNNYMRICHVCLKPRSDEDFPSAGKSKLLDNVCSDCQPSTQVKKKRIKTKKKRGY